MPKDFTVGAFIKARDEASKTVQKVEGRFSKLSHTLSTRVVAAAAAAGIGLVGLKRVLTSVIQASGEQELAVKRLDAALSPLGASARAVSKELQEQAAALQKVTTAGDEQIINGQALVASFTRNTEEIKGATVAALDLAAATGQSLQSAFLLMGRAAAGETGTLSRYGIIIDKNVPITEKFAAVLEAVNKQFGGQAQAEAETYLGIVKQLGGVWGDAKERIGDAVTKNEDARKSLESLKTSIQESTAFTKAVGDTITFWISRVSDGTRSMVEWIDMVQAGLKWAGLMSAETAKLGEAIEDTTEKVDKLTAAEKRRLEIEEALVKQEEDIKKVFKDLGVTLEADVNTALRENEAILGELEAAYRRGMISAQDLENGKAALAESSQKLITELRGETEAMLEMTGVAQHATAVQEEVKSSLDATTDSLRRVSEQIIITSRDFDELAASAGRATAVEAALAGGGQLVLGGTRINLPGGGSRLVRGPRDPRPVYTH